MNHALKGCIKYKGKTYIPLEEIVALCEHLGVFKGDTIAGSLKKSFAKANIPEVEEGLLSKVKSLFFANDAKL